MGLGLIKFGILVQIAQSYHNNFDTGQFKHCSYVILGNKNTISMTLI